MRITFVAFVVVVICSYICDDCKMIASESAKGNPSHVHGRNVADPSHQQLLLWAVPE
jgi:hypothetical protein